MSRSLDAASIRGATRAPGTDMRQWVSYGLVDADTPDARSTQFTDDSGNPLPFPLVNVTLQPSGMQVICRVSAPADGAAGPGEGSWSPFAAGDEVMVVIPQGDEREGCAIIARFTQGRDAFPTSVAGADPTTNTFAFKRTIAPMLFESGTAFLFRVNSNGAFFALDQTGNVTATNSDGHYLALHHDLLAMQTADTSCMVQIDPSGQTVFLQAGGVQLLLDSGNSSGAAATSLLCPGNIQLISSGGGYAPGHAITLEQVVNLLFAVVSGVGPLFTVPLTPPEILALVEAAIVLATTSPITPFTPAITAALEGQTPDPSGTLPGVGRPGFLL